MFRHRKKPEHGSGQHTSQSSKRSASTKTHGSQLPIWSQASSPHRLSSNDGTLQAKLTINQPGDAYEQEADCVADTVMRTPEKSVQRNCACGGDAGSDGECAACRSRRLELQRQSLEEEEGMMQPKRSEGNHDTQTSAPPIVHQVLQTTGRPLHSETRSSMESRFGRDFGHVRVHTDRQANESARAIKAQAYTVGNNIVFGAGRYAPDSSVGQHLLAHELTHVIQQSDRNASGNIQRQMYPPIPIIVTPTAQPVVVNAVDARQETHAPWYFPPRYTGPITNLFRGDVTMTSVATMVANVIAHLDGRRMQRLNIIDHGNQNSIQIGDDRLGNAASVTAFSRSLQRLRSHFASGAIVHVQNCEAGQNQDLICSLAAAFGATVYAGTGLHNPLLGFNLGDYVSCTPGGTFNTDVGRPATPQPPDPSQMA